MTPGPRPDHRQHKAHLRQVEQLTRAGHSAAEIAIRLGCTSRTVVRYRAELRTAAT